MMNNTYSLIISQSEREWTLQWAKTLLTLERSLTNKEKIHYLGKYSINVASPLPNQQPAANGGANTATGAGATSPPPADADADAGNAEASWTAAATTTNDATDQIRRLQIVNGQQQASTMSNEQQTAVVEMEMAVAMVETNGDDETTTSGNTNIPTVPAILIIKRMDITKAKKRQQAIDNWHVSVILSI